MARLNKQRFEKIKEASGSKFVPVGDPEEIDRIIGDSSERNEDESNENEFNPVKSRKLEGMSARELLEAFAEYYVNDKRLMPECIDSFLGLLGQYLEWTIGQGKFATIDQFIVHLKESEEKQSENKKHE